jgi:arylsulfatase A-like enzyme
MNVLHILSDQLHAGCLGFAGHPQAITPNLDRLAAESVRFDRCYAQSPICTPSRTSMLSGQYNHNTGYFALNGPRPELLPSYMSHFKEQGYRTAGIGKLHTPDHPRNWLEDHLDLFGDTYFTVDGQPILTGTDWIRDLEARGYLETDEFQRVHNKQLSEPQESPSLNPFEMSQEGWCVREAIRFIEEKDGPFCMQVSLERPHDPCIPAQEFWDMYSDDLDLPETLNNPCDHRPPHFQNMYNKWREKHGDDFTRVARLRWKGYLASITHMDHAVGLLLDYLDEKGLADNTIVVFNADHGGYMAQFGIYEKAPGICSDAVCRVPCLWRVPGVTHGGTVNRALVENVDIAPTFAALAGLPPMSTADGQDITALLSGGEEPVREIAVTEHPQTRAMVWNQWRFVHYPVEMFGEDVGELYDIENDPDETCNLYHDPDHQGVVNICRKKLLDWLINTTRVKTAQVINNNNTGPRHQRVYEMDGDGKIGHLDFRSLNYR